MWFAEDWRGLAWFGEDGASQEKTERTEEVANMWEHVGTSEDPGRAISWACLGVLKVEGCRFGKKIEFMSSLL